MGHVKRFLREKAGITIAVRKIREGLITSVRVTGEEYNSRRGKRGGDAKSGVGG